MIRIADKQQCCGCGACEQKCPRRCISLEPDYEGFLYPQVNLKDCVDCGLCEMVCPVINPYDAHTPIQTFAAINKDETTRKASSSGGIFSLLAEMVIREGGVVFGARFDDKWQVILDYSVTVSGLSAFRGSKYVQARTGDTFRQCKEFLNEGRRVMFSGTPCQIAGLKHFLRRDYDNLLTVDLVCHGVPSPKVWGLYIKEVAGSVKNISSISMRDKSSGWKSFSFVISYIRNNQTVTLLDTHNKNDYMKAFLKDLILRPSCYKCAAKEFRSCSDITIADFWGIQSVAPAMDDDKGTGLVLLHTKKAQDIFSIIDITRKETSFDDCLRCNPAIVRSAKPWYSRDNFFKRLSNSESVIYLIRRELKPSPQMFYRDRINVLMSLPKRLLERILILFE